MPKVQENKSNILTAKKKPSVKEGAFFINFL